MTHRIFVALALLVLATLAVDFFSFGGAATLFLVRKFMEFSDWIAFWR
jgi:hypothetical protein